MQAENDDDLDGGQRSLEIKWGRGRILFQFARIKIDFKVSIITHFNGEIDSHIWMLRESLRESILGFLPNF